MIYIKHRVNQIAQLNEIEDLSFGCEIDLRSDSTSRSSLIVTHDPWGAGANFESWLEVFSEKKLSGPLIVNTKEDGLESIVIEKLNNYGIENYFFLDTCIPTLVKMSQGGFNKFAVRYSNYEPIEFVLKFENLVQWVWVDCFQNRYPIFTNELKKFRICVVSPELQGFGIGSNPESRKWISSAEAICTKEPSFWINQ